jgi:hypothetical protein
MLCRRRSPPIQITGNPYIDWAVLFFGFIIVVYYLKAIRLARATIRQGIRLFIGGFLLGLGYYVARGKMGGDAPQADGILFGVLALLFVPRRKRSRYIPRSVKRAVIARDLARNTIPRNTTSTTNGRFYAAGAYGR